MMRTVKNLIYIITNYTTNLDFVFSFELPFKQVVEDVEPFAVDAITQLEVPAGQAVEMVGPGKVREWFALSTTRSTFLAHDSSLSCESPPMKHCFNAGVDSRVVIIIDINII